MAANQFSTTTPVREIKLTVAAQPLAGQRCFICGAPALGLSYWPIHPSQASPLDAYAANIAYQRPGCACHRTHPGCTRVAVLDGKATPLHLAGAADIPDLRQRTAYNVSAVDEALAFLAGQEA